MVNPGRASTGCATCRSRRVKCDGAYPICTRCAKSGIVCLGYSPAPAQLIQPNTKLQFVTSFGGGDPLQSADLSSGLFRFDQSSFSPGVASTLEIIKASFQTLREPTQTPDVRRKQHEEYGMALRAFRQDLSSSPASGQLFVAAFLFALYEVRRAQVCLLKPGNAKPEANNQMTVDVASESSTGWQSHLAGLLTLLRQSLPAALCKRLSILLAALQLVGDVVVSPEMETLDKAQLLLDVAKLRLRALSFEMDQLFSSSHGRRKIDVERIRRSVRYVHRNLALVSSTLPNEATPSSTPWRSDNPQHCSPDFHTVVMANEYRTLVIISSSLLLRSGDFLHPGTASIDYGNTREYKDLSRSIQTAIDGICASFYSYFGNGSSPSADNAHHPTAEVGTAEAMCTLTAMWPLYCASQARSVPVHQQEQIRNLLWDIGARSRVPKAMSLAMATTSQSEGNVFSESLAGLLLVGLL